jgi:hypothetical protein
MNSNFVKTSELNLSRKLIKDRREDINRWCDGLKSSFNRILDHMEKGYVVSDGFMGINFKEAELKSINDEIDENYNFSRKEKCEYCAETFIGLMANARKNEHEWKNHKREVEKSCAIGCLQIFGVMNSVMDNMSYHCAVDFYKKTNSEAAKEKIRLMKAGEDIPVELERQYSKEYDEYYQKQLPFLKKEKRDDSYLDKYPNGKIPGRKAVINGITESIKNILKYDSTPPDKKLEE